MKVIEKLDGYMFCHVKGRSEAIKICRKHKLTLTKERNRNFDGSSYFIVRNYCKGIASYAGTFGSGRGEGIQDALIIRSPLIK